VLGEGSAEGVGAILARAVILATGGMGQIFASTTNPAVSTGDGVALAMRAGAAVTDLEFVQFHPTALHLASADGVQQPLVSEALRGEGAHLVDADGKRFMLGQHELAELAPRDVVAKGIHRELLATGTDHVFLDARHLPGMAARFPTITAACLASGVDPSVDLIPVAPAAHYASGGVRTDLHGRTSIPGLYACGEVACTGVHGANRLASNSLLEGLVFARRIADDIARDLPPQADPQDPRTFPEPAAIGAPPGGRTFQQGESIMDAGDARAALQRTMTIGAGVLRSAESLEKAASTLRSIGAGGRTGTAAWELTNLVTVASALIAAAHVRRETRGCHWREDFPDAEDAWSGHVLGAIGPDGALTPTWEPLC
jgi:L-aspartate oxidase